MIRTCLFASVFQILLATAASAQSEKLPADLAGLPVEIKTLPWQTIDKSSVTPLERCRALLLMNHTLDELCANVTAEADLMSSYIEKKDLGKQFASTPPPPAPAELSFADAQSVSVALLRGPMSGSYYATELSGLDPGTLTSYEQMYQRTCQRRWSEFEESRHLVRCMSSFLGNSDKLQDYDAWATAESARRELEHQQQHSEAAKAQQHDAAVRQKMEAQLSQQQRELQQMQAALAAAHAQQQQSAQGQPQPAGQTMTPAGQPAQAVNGGYVVNSPYAYGYGGYGGYGYTATPAGAAAAGAYAGANAANNENKNAAAAGANAANNENKNAAAAGAAAANSQAHNPSAGQAAAGGQYHAANSSWNRSSSYHGTAQAQTSQRTSSFHGGGGRR